VDMGIRLKFESSLPGSFGIQTYLESRVSGTLLARLTCSQKVCTPFVSVTDHAFDPLKYNGALEGAVSRTEAKIGASAFAELQIAARFDVADISKVSLGSVELGANLTMQRDTVENQIRDEQFESQYAVSPYITGALQLKFEGASARAWLSGFLGVSDITVVTASHIGKVWSSPKGTLAQVTDPPASDGTARFRLVLDSATKSFIGGSYNVDSVALYLWTGNGAPSLLTTLSAATDQEVFDLNFDLPAYPDGAMVFAVVNAKALGSPMHQLELASARIQEKMSSATAEVQWVRLRNGCQLWQGCEGKAYQLVVRCGSDPCPAGYRVRYAATRHYLLQNATAYATYADSRVFLLGAFQGVGTAFAGHYIELASESTLWNGVDGAVLFDNWVSSVAVSVVDMNEVPLWTGHYTFRSISIVPCSSPNGTAGVCVVTPLIDPPQPIAPSN